MPVERLVEYLMIYSIRTALLALFSLCFSGSYLQQGYGSSMHSNLRMYQISGGICFCMCVRMQSRYVCLLLPGRCADAQAVYD